MSEQSAKPYLVRAICEWCADNGLTPYLAVKVNGADARAGARSSRTARSCSTSATSATRRLTIDNDGVRFSARFSGASQEVAVPMAACRGIFAKETGYGFAFAVAQSPAASLAAASAPAERDVGAALRQGRPATAGTPRTDDGAKSRPSHLQVIK